MAFDFRLAEVARPHGVSKKETLDRHYAMDIIEDGPSHIVIQLLARYDPKLQGRSSYDRQRVKRGMALRTARDLALKYKIPQQNVRLLPEEGETEVL